MRLIPSLLAAAALVATAPMATSAAPVAADHSGCQTVHVGPAPVAGKASSSYFELSLAAGHHATADILVANPEPYACHVTLLPALAHTAVNSGETYPPLTSQSQCAASSCWLSGLPRTVTVPAQGRIDVPFTVAVPASTKAGQFLAGVVAQSADGPGASSAGGTTAGQGVVSARVVARVALGVAVTVPGALDPSITISSVTIAGNGVQGQPTVSVTEENTGNTWERPAGTLQVQKPSGTMSSRGLPMTSATVLPGDRATLSLAVSGVTAGAHDVSVVLWYAHHTKKAVWSGTLVFPVAAAVKHVGNSTVVSLAGKGTAVPTWLMGVLAALGALVLLLVVALFTITTRRRRRVRKAPVGHGKHRAPPRELVSAGAPGR